MWSLGMILHKMLFFRLPYQHASDSPGKMDSKIDNKDTMDLLQNEVLNYAGYVVMTLVIYLLLICHQFQVYTCLNHSVCISSASSCSSGLIGEPATRQPCNTPLL